MIQLKLTLSCLFLFNAQRAIEGEASAQWLALVHVSSLLFGKSRELIWLGMMVLDTWWYYAGLTLAIDMSAHIFSILLTFFSRGSYEFFNQAAGFKHLRLYAFFTECLPFVVVSAFVFSCFEKTSKERFVINNTNEKTRKFLLGLLDKQPNGSLIVKENCDILFFNQAVYKFVITTLRMKHVPLNILTLISDDQEPEFKAFIKANFANFKKQQDKPASIELRIRKTPAPEHDEFEGFMIRNGNGHQQARRMSILPVVAESFSSDTSQKNRDSDTSFTSDDFARKGISEEFFQKFEIIKVEAQPYFYKDQKTLILTI